MTIELREELKRDGAWFRICRGRAFSGNNHAIGVGIAAKTSGSGCGIDRDLDGTEFPGADPFLPSDLAGEFGINLDAMDEFDQQGLWFVCDHGEQACVRSEKRVKPA